MKLVLVLLLAAVVTCVSTAAEPVRGQYRHVVLFKFKDNAPKDKVAEVEAGARQLLTKIETVVDLEWGTNVSPENKNQGFTHCFLVTFKDKAGLEKYLPHPKHKDFVKLLGGIVDKVLVVDFVAQ